MSDKQKPGKVSTGYWCEVCGPTPERCEHVKGSLVAAEPPRQVARHMTEAALDFEGEIEFIKDLENKTGIFAPKPTAPTGTPQECKWCHGNPCTCPKPLTISESDTHGVFGCKCEQPNCPVCHPDMTSTEWAELYERAAGAPTGTGEGSEVWRRRTWDATVLLCETRGHSGYRPCEFCRMQTRLDMSEPSAEKAALRSQLAERDKEQQADDRDWLILAEEAGMKGESLEDVSREKVVAHIRTIARDLATAQARIATLQEMLSAKDDLLVAHRLGDHKRADKALARIAKAYADEPPSGGTK